MVQYLCDGIHLCSLKKNEFTCGIPLSGRIENLRWAYASYASSPTLGVHYVELDYINGYGIA